VKEQRRGWTPFVAPRRNRDFFWEELDDFLSEYGWWLLAAVVGAIAVAIAVAIR
jgi:hypothetical protein